MIPLTEFDKEAAGDSYAAVEGWMRGLALKWAARHRLDPDDCVSAAHLAVLEAWARFDREAGAAWKTWAGSKIRYALKDVLTARIDRATRLPMADDGGPALRHRAAKPDQESPVLEALAAMPEDARFVAELALDPPIDVRANVAAYDRESFHFWKLSIRRYLLDLGWPFDRIDRAFDDVRRAL